MLFNIPNENYKECYESLWKWLQEHKPGPLHSSSMLEYNTKYLGHYIGFQGVKESPEAFQVYDLYLYMGSKFRDKCFIARFGDQPTDYVEGEIVCLAAQSNKELKTYAVGEAYRRYKKRNICKGVYS